MIAFENGSRLTNCEMDALNSDKWMLHRNGVDYEASFSDSSKSATTPVTRPANNKRKRLDKGSEEYETFRANNNEAVRASRNKLKAKTAAAQDQVNILMHENRLLNQKVAFLENEFELLNDLYQVHVKYASSSEPMQEIDLRTLMAPHDSNE